MATCQCCNGAGCEKCDVPIRVSAEGARVLRDACFQRNRSLEAENKALVAKLARVERLQIDHVSLERYREETPKLRKELAETKAELELVKDERDALSRDNAQMREEIRLIAEAPDDEDETEGDDAPPREGLLLRVARALVNDDR